MNLQQILGDWLAQWIPRKSDVSSYNFRSEPTFQANLMDVDYLRQVIYGAEMGNVRDLFALYRDIIASDSHIQAELSKRKLAVLGDVISIQPVDKKNPNDVLAANCIKDMIDNHPKIFLDACEHLMDSTLYPLSIVEKIYKPSTRFGLRYELAELNPVPHITIDYTTAYLKLRKIDDLNGFATGTLIDADPNRYMVHRGHMLKNADYWGGPMRSLLFWWLLGAMDRDWWARFLDRYGSPFIVAKYDQSDDATRSILNRAFGLAQKVFGLVVSKDTEIDLISAQTQSAGEAFNTFLNQVNDEKSKLIVGQVSSSKTMSGLGSGGVSKQHESVRQDIRQFDQMKLGATLRTDLFLPYLNINGVPGRPPRCVWGGMSTEEIAATGTLLQSLATAGIEPTDEGLQSVGENIAIPLQRKAVPASPGGPAPMTPFTPYLMLDAGDRLVSQTHRSIDQIAAKGAPDLAQSFRGALAPVRRIISESRTPEECQARLVEFYADWRPEKLSAIIAEALECFAANGAASRSR